MKNAFSYRETKTSVSELLHLVDGAVEAVDNPDLAGLMLFVQSQKEVGGFDVVDDERLLILLAEQDVLFEDFDLKGKRRFV